jgi:hypothetical protein
VLEDALREHVGEVSIEAGALLIGRGEELAARTSRSRVVRVAATLGPAAVGFATQPLGPHVAKGASKATAGSLWVFGRHNQRQLTRLRNAAEAAAHQRFRRQGTIQAELFGPVDARYWSD